MHRSREKSFQALPPIFLQSCETKSGTESLGSRLGRRVHNANSKHRIFSICRVYLAMFFNVLQVFSTNRTTWIWRTGVFFCADRQTDATDHFTPYACAQGNYTMSAHDVRGRHSAPDVQVKCREWHLDRPRSQATPRFIAVEKNQEWPGNEATTLIHHTQQCDKVRTMLIQTQDHSRVTNWLPS